jgi:hypothetical protein
MAGLTPKQARFVQECASKKLAALRKISEHLGLVPVNEHIRPTQDDYKRLREKLGGAAIRAVITLLADDDAEPCQRAAAAGILDILSDEWRDYCPSEVLGAVVDRNSPEVRAWRREVLERDGWRCTRCGSEQELHAHHVARWADAPALRIIASNGQALCRECHGAEHGQKAHS